MCFSCLKPKGACKQRICINHSKLPKALKCPQGALWEESKSLAPISIFFCKQREHGESRASLSEIKSALEKYIGKLANGIVEANILFAVNVMFKTNTTIEDLGNLEESGTWGEDFYSSSSN